MKINLLLKILVFFALLVVLATGFLVYLYEGRLDSDSRVINYAGIVRGMTQRVVKLEFGRHPEISESLIAELDTIIAGLKHGDETLGLPPANDAKVLQSFEEIEWRWNRLKERIREARDHPEAREALIDESEEYFAVTNAMVENFERASMEKHHDAQKILLAVISLYAVMILFAYAFIWYRVLRPLREIMTAVPKVAEGDFSYRILLKSNDEFRALAEAFNEMTVTLAQSYRSLEKEIEDKTFDINQRLAEVHRVNTELEQKKGAMLNLLEDAQMAEKESTQKAKQLGLANKKISIEKERTEGILRFLQSIGEVVYATDTERRVVFINEAGANLMGSSPDEIIGSHTSEHILFEIGENERRIRYFPIRETLKSRKKIIFPPHTFCVREKERIPISGTAAPIFDKRHQLVGVIISFLDDTEKFRFEKSKDRFLSVAAHQLRTPLGSMRWTIEYLAKGKLGKISKEAEEAIHQLEENNNRMLMLVNELLNIARIEEGATQEEKSETDVVEVVKEAAKALERRSKELGMPIQIHAPKTGVPKLMITRKHCFEAVENLLVNALQYNRDGEPIRIDIKTMNDSLSISISDRGIGIPERDQSRIFTKFYRARNAIRKFTDGTGLGLSVVKSYVEESGGTISFVSKENVGTTFTITFPIPRQPQP